MLNFLLEKEEFKAIGGQPLAEELCACLLSEIDKTKSHLRIHAAVGVLVELLALVCDASRKVLLDKACALLICDLPRVRKALADKLLLFLMCGEHKWLGDRQDGLTELCSDYDYNDDLLPFDEIKSRLDALI